MNTWLAVSLEGDELCCNEELHRSFNRWSILTEDEIKSYCYEADGNPDDCIVILPKGSIKKLIGRELSWEDNPVLL